MIKQNLSSASNNFLLYLYDFSLLNFYDFSHTNPTITDHKFRITLIKAYTGNLTTYESIDRYRLVSLTCFY